MTENEQIAELRDEISKLEQECRSHCKDRKCVECRYFFSRMDCQNEFIAQGLTAKGYRKASEVAREIFEEFLKEVSLKMPTKLLLVIHQKGYDDGVVQGKREAFFDIIEVVSKLKKKYGGNTNDEE